VVIDSLKVSLTESDDEFVIDTDWDLNATKSFMESLQALAFNLSVPVIITTNVSGRLETRPNSRPILSDLADYIDEPNHIERYANLIAFVYCDKVAFEDPDYRDSELNIIMNNTGNTGTVNLTFDEQCIKFTET